jgi:hypothetical protein
MSAPQPQTPQKKGRSLHRDLTWMFKLNITDGHNESELVVQMALCPTSSIPTDKAKWWTNMLKTGKQKWAELQFLKDSQKTGISFAFALHRF